MGNKPQNRKFEPEQVEQIKKDLLEIWITKTIQRHHISKPRLVELWLYEKVYRKLTRVRCTTKYERALKNEWYNLKKSQEIIHKIHKIELKQEEKPYWLTDLKLAI